MLESMWKRVQAEDSEVVKFTAHVMSKPSTDHIPLECGTCEEM